MSLHHIEGLYTKRFLRSHTLETKVDMVVILGSVATISVIVYGMAGLATVFAQQIFTANSTIPYTHNSNKTVAKPSAVISSSTESRVVPFIIFVIVVLIIAGIARSLKHRTGKYKDNIFQIPSRIPSCLY